MGHETAVSLVTIAAAAVIAPLLAELLSRWRIPSVLFELLLGIAIGPAVLGWVEVDEFIGGLSDLGLAVLFFLAGYEINFAKLKGRPINRGLGAWGISLVLGLGVGVFLAIEGLVISSLLIGLALTTTAIGTLLPMLRDRQLLDTRFGVVLTAAGAVGEFGPIIAITVLLGAASPITEGVLLISFGVVAVIVAAIARRPQSPRLIEMLHRHLSTSTQLPVRIMLLLITLMVLLAARLGLDFLLGAFAAGIIARLALSQEQNEALSPRLEAIGFGFLIPVFFIVSGVNFDLDSLLGSTTTMLKVPAFLLLMLLVRGVPALFVYRGVLRMRERSSLMLLQATGLPLLVVITQIGLEKHEMTAANAAALVGAGMVSVLVFPLVGFAVLGNDAEDETATDAAEGRERERPGESESLGGLQ